VKYGTGSFTGNTSDIKSDIMAAANPEKAILLERFFKTGKGEYGQGDKFLGLIVPDCRKIAGQYWITIHIDGIVRLLHSEWHEERQIALFMMVLQFNKADPQKQKELFKLFLDNTQYINNWDLVDCNAPRIVGKYIHDNQKLLPILDKLALSKSLWDRRIAVISTLFFIVNGDPTPTLRIVEKLLTDKHYLIQKANGWMLRELGKRIDDAMLVDFLKKHYHQMPRTTLRYAIEKFNQTTRARYLSGNFTQ
jgi:3-methyladenine DNA glycosylase AlkD